MRSHSTGGVARPGVLNKTGNPYSTMGFGWQDWTDNYRYTDTYDTAGTQNLIIIIVLDGMILRLLGLLLVWFLLVMVL